MKVNLWSNMASWPPYCDFCFRGIETDLEHRQCLEEHVSDRTLLLIFEKILFGLRGNRRDKRQARCPDNCDYKTEK